MNQSTRADVTAADDAAGTAPLDPKSFLVSCAACSLLGLTVLAVLAQSLLAFLAPAA